MTLPFFSKSQHGRWTGLFLGVVGVGLLAGCMPRHLREYPAPAAASLLEVVRDRQATVQSLNLETRTTSWLGGERVRATVLMLVKRSGALRFEAEISLKGTVAALATDGQSFALIEMESRTVKRGPACPSNIAQMVRIPLAPDEIAAILLGDAPIGDDARAVNVAWDERRGVEILEVTGRGGGGAARHLWIALRRDSQRGIFTVVAVEGTGANGQRWRVHYEDPDEQDGVLFPGLIRFAEPGRSFDDGVEIKVRDRRVNPTVASDAFLLDTPPGFDELAVGCDQDPPPLPPAPPPP